MDAPLDRGPRSGHVVVVGAGPVGLTTALLLTRLHVGVSIVDSSSAPVSQSRATDLHPATLERLAPFGVTPFLTEIGQAITRVNVSCGGRRVGTYHLGRPGSPFPFALSVPQCTTEAVLQQLLAEQGVKVDRSVECVAVRTIGRHAEVDLRPIGTTAVETRRADWVVAGDGADSTVRRRLGIAFPGVTSSTRFAIADMLAALPFDRAEMHLHLDRDGGVHVLPMPVDGYVRLFLDRWRGGDRGTPDPAEFAHVVSERLGIAAFEPAHTRWASSFVVHRRVADRFRDGRIVLVGDAAHLCTPVGGQGLNLGIGDACDVASSIAAQVHGRADDAIVTVIADRRRRIALRTSRAAWLAMRMNGLGGVAATVRDAVAPHCFTPSRRLVTAWLAGALDRRRL